MAYSRLDSNPAINQYPLFKDIGCHIMHSILHYNNYCTPFVVGLCLIHVSPNNFVSKLPLNPDFLSKFIPFRQRVYFVFKKIKKDGGLWDKVVLTEIKLRQIKETEYHYFLEKNPMLSTPGYEMHVVGQENESFENNSNSGFLDITLSAY